MPALQADLSAPNLVLLRPGIVHAEETVAAVRAELEELQVKFDDDVAALDDAYDAQAEELQEIPIRPLAKNVHIELLRLAWVPYVEDET